MNPDITGLLWSFLYVGAVLALGEIAVRSGLSREGGRKIIHVGVGLWVFGTLALFQSRSIAVIPPLIAVVGNYFLHRGTLLGSMSGEAQDLGTVWFPASFAVLIVLFWDVPAALAAGMIAMTVGDPLAWFVGTRWGKRRYRYFQTCCKTLEGSLAMMAGTFAGVLPVLRLYRPGEDLALLVPLALLVAVVAMVAEGLGVRGRDNLWVPLSAGAVAYLGLEVLAAQAVTSLAIGALLATGVSIAAWRAQALTPSGVLGAILTGTLVFGLGGWPGGVAMVAFFVSASVLSRLFKSRKASLEADYAKTGNRDLGQVMANGGVAAAAALMLGLGADQQFLGALLGALAGANADTWATELGVLSPTPPRMITSGKVATPGTSGAITLTGTAATLAGGAFVGVAAALVSSELWAAVPAIALAGLGGSLLDSLLGALVQGIYWCPACQKETERTLHHCGTKTFPRRGFPWIGNDLVNFLTTLASAVLGYVLMPQ